MYSSDVLESLIHSLYEAAFAPARWDEFLKELARELDGVLPTLFLHDTRTHSGALALNVGYDEDMVRAYKEYYAERNMWLRSGADLLTAGCVRTSHMMCPRRTFLRSEWYSDYCRKLEISQGIGATILKETTGTANIAVFSDASRPEFGSEEIRLLQALMPHLKRALEVHSRLAEADLRRCELTEALDRVTVGIMLVDVGAHVLFMNRTARCLVEARDGLFIDGTGLRAAHPRETSALRALIGAASQTSARRSAHPGGSFRIARQTGLPTLEVTVSPVSVGQISSLRLTARAVAAVYVTDPAQIPERPEATLVRLHGLTPAEAKVALLIARGRSGRQAAEALGVSYNTLKTHLKRLFAKTGTRSQAELMRLIVLGAGQVIAPGSVSEALPQAPRA